ncbi:MAG: BamA/TamA family outer membrane protein [Calditrichaeota bacterium]|nr:BamA/TamA family outer membrane protein [Calditrichota bacterium]
MLAPKRIALCLLLLTLFGPQISARADFTLEEFESWQRHSGWLIRVVEFPGIHSFARSDLLEVMATEKPTWLRRYLPLGSRTIFYAEDFAADILRVQNFYHREGFPNAIVRGRVLPNEKSEELRLIVEIQEGDPLLLRSWSFKQTNGSHATLDSARWARALPVRSGKRLAQTELAASADTLVSKLQLNGHARAKVTFDTLNVSLDSADVVFNINAGNYCRFGQTRITGLKQIEEASARRELAYEPLDPYTPRALEETRKNLLRLEAFRMVRTDVDLEQPGDTLNVLIRTEEGNRYFVRLGAGLDAEEGAHLSGQLTDLNFFGRARRFTLETGAADILARRGSSGLFNDIDRIDRRVGFSLFWPHTPYNSTDITLKPLWEYEYKDGTIVRTSSATTRLSASPLPRVTASISNEFGRQNVLVDTVGGSNRISTISIEALDLGWDTRDNPLVPRKGHILSASFAESGLLWNIDNRWWRTILSGRVLIPLDQFTVAALRAETGFMGPLHNSSETPVQERFRLGGVANVRGWGRDRIGPRAPDDNTVILGGDYSLFGTFELQRDIWGPVGLALFSDVGNVWEKTTDARLGDLLPSVGAGVRFLTLVGPIRFDVGYQLRENPYNDPPWAYHILLGSPF